MRVRTCGPRRRPALGESDALRPGEAQGWRRWGPLHAIWYSSFSYDYNNIQMTCWSRSRRYSLYPNEFARRVAWRLQPGCIADKRAAFSKGHRHHVDTDLVLHAGDRRWRDGTPRRALIVLLGVGDPRTVRSRDRASVPACVGQDHRSTAKPGPRRACLPDGTSGSGGSVQSSRCP